MKKKMKKNIYMYTYTYVYVHIKLGHFVVQKKLIHYKFNYISIKF